MTAAGPRSKPKVWSVSMVRNEADIVEAFVRPNASILDGMAIIDHGSIDGTLSILTSLARERLPLILIKSTTPGYLQEQITTATARDVFAQTGADFVMPLDADEFLKVPSRDAFDRALQAFPPRMNGLLHWLTYVPDFSKAGQGTLALLASARRLSPERQIFHKALMSRYLMEQPEATLANGNHFVARRLHGPPDDAEPHARIRDVFAVLRNQPVDDALLLEHAVNWSVPRPHWAKPGEVGFVDDPFLAPMTLRYTPPAAADPLPLVLSATDRMVQRLAAARRSNVRPRPPDTAPTR
jgi:hypothetical protein